MTFLVLVATFVGLSCVVIPLLLMGAYALFDRDDSVEGANGSDASTVTRLGG